MATRGAIIINNIAGEREIAIYKHYDSYIHGGLGAKLFYFLVNRRLVNGYTLSEAGEQVQVNGLGDLGAQLVTELKERSDNTGNVYIMCETEDVGSDVEYIYTIAPSSTESGWEISVTKDETLIFKGSPEKAIAHFNRNPNKPLQGVIIMKEPISKPDYDTSATTIFDDIKHVKCTWRYYLNLPGIKYPPVGFEENLMNAIVRAGGDNLSRLALGFPVYVEVFTEWKASGKIK